MADTQFNPGTADVVEAIMTSHDGSKSRKHHGNKLCSFSLSQTMSSASYNGSLNFT